MPHIQVHFNNLNVDELIAVSDMSFNDVKDLVKYCDGAVYSPTLRKWFLDLTENNLERLKVGLTPDSYNLYKDKVKEKQQLPANCDILYPFQRDGVKQLLSGKTLLADEVGLGKTLQAAAYCETENFSRVLIVSPAPLKFQWKDEIEKHFKKNVTVFHGTPEQRDKIFRDFEKSTNKYLVINYEQLSESNTYLNDINWNCIILDEVHKVKNSQTVAYKFIRKYMRAKRKLGMTATPLVNNLREVFNIMNLLTNNKFMTWVEFSSRHAHYINIKRRNKQTRQIEEIRVIDFYYNSDEFYKKLEPHMIRRKKKEIFEQVPPRIYKVIHFELSEEEKRLHDNYIAKAKDAFKNEDEDNLLKYITHARQCCNAIEILPEEEKINLDIKQSTKIETLLAVLEEIEDKVLIFTQYERMARAIEKIVGQENCIVVSGATSDKLGEVKRFKESTTHKYLISTDTLNYGVNMEFIHNLIHIDLPWTPAKVEQREGRIDRITQTESMYIVKLIAKDSFDEHVANILEMKQKEFDKAIEGGSAIVDTHLIDIAKQYFKQLE